MKKNDKKSDLEQSACVQNQNPPSETNCLNDIADRTQPENTLRETVTLLTQTEHIGKMGSWSADLAENMIVSEEMRRIMGFTDDEAVTGENIRRRKHPIDRLKQTGGITNQEEIIPAPTSAAKPQTGCETILRVEDESSLLKMTETMLRRLGYSVLSALTPEEALRLAAGHSSDIHLFITDIIMPHMNGRELADQLQSIRPDLRCLFMSRYTVNVIAKKRILDNGVHFIQKPFLKTDLTAKVRDAIHQAPETDNRQDRT